MYLGTDYYPEHVAESQWHTDARLMREAGMNIVRLAEFAWSVMEPQEGVYSFGWMDDAISILAGAGMKIVLGTPTATPPKWLVDKYPDMLQRDRHGMVRSFGSRRHYCCNNGQFKKHTCEIVRRLAEHYSGRAEIAAWQIDNEFGGHDTTCCYCPDCLSLFRVWLENRYGSIEELNRQWGTVFWSQRYTSFNEVDFPSATVCDGTDETSHGLNPGLVLDFQRFSSESVVSYQQMQIDTIRKYCDKPVTHNFMGHFPDLDYFELARNLDFVSWDNYPNSQWGGSYGSVGMAHDLMRGLKGRNFWVMEQQSGPCGWSALGDTPRPGQLRLYTWQAVAHGAEAILYFPWRACPFGAEQYWYGVLDHDSVPRRRYTELQNTIGELKRLSETIGGAEVAADIALVKSYDNLWSHRNQPHNRNFDYSNLLQDYYMAVTSSGYTVDVTGIGPDLSQYKAVLLPAFNLTTPDLAVQLDEYVRQGGTLVVTFRSGTRNWNNSISSQTIPGPFAAMAGIEVEEFDSLNSGRTVGVLAGTIKGVASIWCDIIKATTANPVAVYTAECYAGKPAVTLNQYGRGRVYYVGCDLDAECLKGLLSTILEEAGVQPVLRALPPDVEAVAKAADGKRHIIVLNHGDTAVSIPLEQEYNDLITGQSNTRQLQLAPYAVAVLIQPTGKGDFNATGTF